MEHRLNTNTSLPQDTYTAVGDDATFYCEVGSNDAGDITPPLLDFEISLPSDGSLFVTTKCWQWNECSDWSPNHLPTDIYIRPIATLNLPTYVRYLYEIRLANVVPQLNGSTFSCSISTSSHGRTGPPVYLTQWKGSASLFVQGELPVTSAGVPSQSPRNYESVIVSVSVVVSVLLLLIIISIALVAIGVWKWRRQQKYNHFEPAQEDMNNISGTVAVPFKNLND